MTPTSMSRLLFGLVFGALVGAVAGALLEQPLAGAATGALAGTLLSMTVDMRRGLRLLDWLRGPQHTDAPRDQGYWGELAYRIERALRQKDQAVVQERERLAQFLAAIEASPNGVMLLDGNDQIEWCNTVAAVVRGLPAGRGVRRAGHLSGAAGAQHRLADGAALRRGHEAPAVAGHHRARTCGVDAPRFRGQRIA